MRPAIPANEEKILLAQSGGKCAFSGCGKSLVTPGTLGAEPLFTGEICHIVASSRQGPRGRTELSEEDRNKHPNLVVLCQEHHGLVDKRPQVYSVRILRELKRRHEEVIAGQGPQMALSYEMKSENLQSTCMAVTQFPDQVFFAHTDFHKGDEYEIKARRNWDNYEGRTPFFLADDRLYTFCDLRQQSNPFKDVVDASTVSSVKVDELLKTQEGHNRVMRMLNMALRQHLGSKKISYDGMHHRFYFVPKEKGQPREERYKTLTGRTATRSVVWRPIQKKTGEPKNFWWHLAADISFLRAGPEQWVLCIRPERTLTEDSEKFLEGKSVGRRITSLKATMRNDKYLDEVHFWRFILSAGTSDIILSFGHQHVLVDSTLLSVPIEWPGTHGDAKDVSYLPEEDDLFTFARRQDVLEDGLDEDPEMVGDHE